MRTERAIFTLAFVMLLFCASGVGCSPTSQSEGSPEATEVLRVAVTTSTRDSGLLKEILPPFEKQTGVRVDVIAVGTGAALKLGERGDVDALLCHAPEKETQFMQAGHGTRREPFMRNYFVILGPESDPAEIGAAESPVEAMQRIASTEQLFLSRGDESGTHHREKLLWGELGGLPRWANYLEAGQGMGQTLVIADEKQAYTLCDRATYLNFRSRISLVPLASKGAELENRYTVIAVHPQKNSQIKAEPAERFLNYLISDSTQRRIAEFSIEGEQLFEPLRRPPEASDESSF